MEDFNVLKNLGIDPNDPEQINKAFSEKIGAISEEDAKAAFDRVKEVTLSATLSDDEVKEIKEKLDYDGFKNDRAEDLVQLSDEETESIAKAAEAAYKGPDKEMMDSAKQEAEKDHEGYETEATVRQNPDTGEKSVIATNEDSPYLEETFDEFVANHANDEIDMTAREDSIQKAILDVTGASEVDAVELAEFVSALQRYQKNEISANETYRFMPKILQDFAAKQLAGNISALDYEKYRTTLNKRIIDNLIEDAAFDKYIIDMEIETKAIYDEFGRETNKFYQESIEDKISALEELKDSLAEDNTEGKLVFEEWLAGLRESFEMTELKAAAPKIKLKKFDFEKPDKAISQFNAKYIKSKYNIQDIKNMFRVLHFKVGLEQEDALCFGLVFIKFCQNFKPSNLKEHVYMYYTISNIISLAASPNNEYSEIGQKVVDNVKEVVKLSKSRNGSRISK